MSFRTYLAENKSKRTRNKGVDNRRINILPPWTLVEVVPLTPRLRSFVESLFPEFRLWKVPCSGCLDVLGMFVALVGKEKN